jgi:hypothetical protein
MRRIEPEQLNSKKCNSAGRAFQVLTIFHFFILVRHKHITSSVRQQYNIVYRYRSDFLDIVSRYRNLFDIDIVSNFYKFSKIIY